LFLPDGKLTPAHYFTLRRLRAMRGGLLVVCATDHPENVPRDLIAQSDAIYWKALPGYDFSAYAIVLSEVANRSPGADVLLINDSIYGPFSDLDAMLDHVPWQMTGFTATSAFENHIQSYAFFLRHVTDARVRSLQSVISPRFAFNRFRDVVNCQETRLAREAARSMSVGSFWFANTPAAGDPSLALALPLLAEGFPFLKRSLLGKLNGAYDKALLCGLLEERGHPVINTIG
jgi:lipopolysaccharide biosynthesis protein